MKLIERKRGAVIEFGGIEYHVARKPTARRMMRNAKPVWSCHPRKGFHVVKLIDSNLWFADQFVKEREDEIEFVAAQMSCHYLQALEKACRPKRAKAGS